MTKLKVKQLAQKTMILAAVLIVMWTLAIGIIVIVALAAGVI